MRLKLGLLGIILITAGLGIPYYLDSQIPRATATVQIHPPALITTTTREEGAGQMITGPGSTALMGR